jgi:probable F420-dependent oxidoreductase
MTAQDSGSSVRFGIATPQIFLEEPMGPGELRDWVRRAEALGYDSLWVQEQILSGVTCLEPIELLTFAAAHTSRVRLGTAVLLTVVRSPAHTAKSLATLDQLSGGRLVAGVGLGAGQARYPAYGITAGDRVARFTEGLRLMKALWTEPRATFKGRFYSVDGAPMEPKPAQKPHPPLWFGAHHPAALRRSVEMGDGFILAGSSSTAEALAELQALRAVLAEMRRDPASFPVSKRVYVAIDRDRDRAGKRLTEWFGRYYGNAEMAARVSVWGSPQECVDRIAELTRAGVGLVILNPVFDQTEHLERLASDVIPALARR